EQIGGSARSYLTLSTLATVLQSWDGHTHHWLTMPLRHGSLFLRWSAGRSADAARVTARLDPARAWELIPGHPCHPAPAARRSPATPTSARAACSAASPRWTGHRQAMPGHHQDPQPRGFYNY